MPRQAKAPVMHKPKVIGRGRGRGSSRPGRLGKGRIKEAGCSGNLILCRKCKVEATADNWFVYDPEDPEKPLGTACTDCGETHAELAPHEDFDDWAASLEEDEEKAEEVEKAEAIKAGKAKPDFETKSAISVERIGWRVYEPMLALTEKQLHQELEEDPKKPIKKSFFDNLPCPRITIPISPDEDEVHYVLANESEPYKRVERFTDFICSTENKFLQPAQNLSPEHARAQMFHEHSQKAEKCGFDFEFTPVLGFTELLQRVQSNQGSTGTPRTSARGNVQSNSSATSSGLSIARPGVTARRCVKTDPTGVSQLDEPRAKAPKLSLPAEIVAFAATSASSVAEPVESVEIKDEEETLAAVTPASSNVAAVVPKGEVTTAPPILMPSPTKAELEDLRKMTPYQKAEYWTGRLCLLSSLVGKSDGRSERQSQDLLEKHEKTQDKMLDEALDKLRTKLSSCRRGDQVSPSKVLALTDKQYKEAVAELLEVESPWPLETQEGLVARHMKTIDETKSYGVEFCKAILPWCYESEKQEEEEKESVPKQQFDPFKPRIACLDAPEHRKIELFSVYFVNQFCIPMLKDGETSMSTFMTSLRSFECYIVESTEDMDLSEELCKMTMDVLNTLRALQLYFALKLNKRILSQTVVSSVGAFEDSKGKSRDSISARVYRAMMASVFYGEKYKDFNKAKKFLLENADVLAEAQGNLIDEPIALVTHAAHAFFERVVKEMPRWELCLPKDMLADVKQACRARCLTHLKESIGARSQKPKEGEEPLDLSGTPSFEELLALVQSCMATWPLVDEFVTTRDAVSAEMNRAHEADLVEKLAEDVAGFIKHLSTLKGDVSKVDDKAVDSVIFGLVSSDGVTVPKTLDAVVSLADALLGTFNASTYWSKGNMNHQLYDMSDHAVNIMMRSSAYKAEYYRSCFSRLQAAHKLSNAAGDFNKLAATIEDQMAKDPKLETIKTVQRALKAVRACTVVALPGTLTWQQVELVISDAENLLQRAAGVAVASSKATLEERMVALDAVAYGAKGNESWSEAFDQDETEENWQTSVRILGKCGIKDIDEKLKEVTEAKKAAELVKDTFESTAFADLLGQCARMTARAEVTKIEGTVMWIVTTHAKDPAKLRTQCQRQKRLLATHEADGQLLMHNRVRGLMLKAISFQ
mmetsp:Transcript_68144/g.176807  ORF Transcript_68144/g.176807 Transcript_68144/m.176807 type:complete len:1158 (-) Transcript_68144:147-3620(-)